MQTLPTGSSINVVVYGKRIVYDVCEKYEIFKSKISFIKRYLPHNNLIAIPYCYPFKIGLVLVLNKSLRNSQSLTT